MIKVLLKNRLIGMLHSMLGMNKSSKNGKGRMVLFVILYAYLAVCMIFLSASMALSLGSILIPAGGDWLYFSVFILASLSILFILSIFETKSELFECRDNDLLLSMPIPEKALVISRIFVVLITNYVIEALIAVPSIVFYAIFGGGINGIIGSVLIFAVTPLLATALASFVGYAVAAIAKRAKRSSIVTIIISLAFLAAYFWGYSALMSGMNELMTNFDFAAIEGKLGVLEFIGNAALLKPLSTISAILVSLFISALIYLLISKNYIKLATYQKSAKKAEYRERRLENKGALHALVSKELAKFFSSSLYMLNAGMGLVFTVAVSVIALAEKSSLLAAVSEMFPALDPGDAIAPLAICAIVLFSSMNMMSASALSLEGKNLWIPKTVPVSDNIVLLSKVLPQIIISTPPTLVASVLMILAINASPVYWIFFILTPFLANVSFAFLGLIFNIIAPKFDFDNEAQPIKQSLPTFLTMMTQMLLSIITIVSMSVLAFLSFGVLAAVIALLLFAALASVLAIILFIPCKRKYAKISV